VGIREAGWVWVLESQGVTSAQATGYAFLVLGIYLASSAVGGLVYLLRGGTIPETALTRTEDSPDLTEPSGVAGPSD
jgi:hypothetical protein